MTTPQRNNQNQKNDNSVAESIKNTAGSAFETVHHALETTENVAINAVDVPKNAANNLTGKTKNKRDSQ